MCSSITTKMHGGVRSHRSTRRARNRVQPFRHRSPGTSLHTAQPPTIFTSTTYRHGLRSLATFGRRSTRSAGASISRASRVLRIIETVMGLPLTSDYPAMEAKLVPSLPEGPQWQYEPKWDGFRCLAFKDRSRVALRSKSGQSLDRYFPEIVDAIIALDAPRCVLDGELVVPEGNILSDRKSTRLNSSHRC